MEFGRYNRIHKKVAQPKSYILTFTNASNQKKNRSNLIHKSICPSLFLYRISIQHGIGNNKALFNVQYNKSEFIRLKAGKFKALNPTVKQSDYLRLFVVCL